MLDLKWIRENPNELDEALDRRGFALKPDEIPEAYRGFKTPSEIILAMDGERRACITALQEMQATRNALSKEIGKAKGKAKGGPSAEADALMAEVVSLKDRTAALEGKERRLSKEMDDLLAGIPNLPAADVPVGDEHANKELRRIGKPRDFGATGFEPKQHFELGEALGLMDFEAAAKISGARFTVLKGQLARLERAIGQFMLDLQTDTHGYTEVNPPLLVKDDAMFGTAQLPKFEDDQYYGSSVKPLTIKENDNSQLREEWTKLNSLGKDSNLTSAEIIKTLRKFDLDKLDFNVWNDIIAFAERAVNAETSLRGRLQHLATALIAHNEDIVTNRRWLIPTAEVPLTN